MKFFGQARFSNIFTNNFNIINFSMFIAFNWIDVSIITVALTNAVTSQNGMYITIGVSIVLILLSIKMLILSKL